MTQLASSTFEPRELAFIQRCFADICGRRGLQGNTEAATDLAAQIFDLYKHGVRNEQDLYARLDRANGFRA